jgi:hypothetical protein
LRWLLVAAVTAVIVILAPGSAHAAWPTCTVPQAKAFYETPHVQVRLSRGRLLACHRGSGEVTRVGAWRWSDTDNYEHTVLLRSWESWLWTFDDTSEAADFRTRMALTDVSSGRRVEVTTHSDLGAMPDFEAAATAGAMVVTSQDGVLALRTDGRIQALSPARDASRPAVVGKRAYWRTADGVAHTATFDVHPVSVRIAPPRARTIGSCRPRPGARLLLHHGKVVVTRVGDSTYACAGGRTHRLARGPVSGLHLTDATTVAYARPGSRGTLELRTGTRDERPVAGAESASASFLQFGQWLDGGVKRVIDPYTGPAYWLDPTGAVQAAG